MSLPRLLDHSALHDRADAIQSGDVPRRIPFHRHEIREQPLTHRTDARLGELWATLQADPLYCDRTTLIVTVDHGRGRTPADWTSHGADIAGADEIWLGCFGGAVRARGELRDHPVLQQRQVAATVAAAVGRDFRTAVPEAASPIAQCLGQ